MKKTLLVIDTNIQVLKIFEMVLKDSMISVFTQQDLKNHLYLITDLNPQIVIFDSFCFDLDFQDELFQLPQSKDILWIGMIKSEDSILTLNPMVKNFIKKPINVGQLKIQVEQLFEGL